MKTESPYSTERIKKLFKVKEKSENNITYIKVGNKLIKANKETIIIYNYGK